jgi:hypothetical protein
MERVDPTIDFDWVRNTPGDPISEDDFSIIWSGFLRSEFSEPYTFQAEADDGVRVWIGDDLVVDRWMGSDAPEGDTAGTGPEIRLQSGQSYPIRVEYFEAKQNASVRLFWSSPSQPREIIPEAHLFSSRRSPEGDGLKGEYRSTERYMAYTQRAGNLYALFFEWPDAELALPIPPPPPGTSISLLGLDQELPWRAEGGTVYVDLSGIPYREIPGQWAWTVRLRGYAEPPRGAR